MAICCIPDGFHDRRYSHGYYTILKFDPMKYFLRGFNKFNVYKRRPKISLALKEAIRTEINLTVLQEMFERNMKNILEQNLNNDRHNLTDIIFKTQ